MKEKPQPFCRACKAPVKHAASAQGAIFVLCPLHAAAVSFDQRAREVVRVIAADVASERIVLVHDADGAGWGHPVPLKAPPQGTPIVMDDGSPRYRDWHRHPIIEDGDTVIGGGEDGVE